MTAAAEPPVRGDRRSTCIAIASIAALLLAVMITIALVVPR